MRSLLFICAPTENHGAVRTCSFWPAIVAKDERLVIQV
jgi:hypothetical protein